MTFEHPIWLALAPLCGILAAALLAFGWHKRSRLLGEFAAPRLLENLTEKSSGHRLLIKAAFVIAAFCAICIALARPQYGVEWSERKARGLDIVFVLDSSRSMLATDLRPTRLERAKLAILDLIDRLESDRIGLVAFAGQAFLQTPPTLDYGAFRESLDATDPSILSRGGSDLGRAIEEAANAFPSENNVKVVVLLTDGEDLGGRAVEAAQTAAEAGIQIYAIGIGTSEGEYLRIRNEQGIEEFVRDNEGQPVRSQLDESTLIEIARITGGSYTQLGAGTLEALYDSVLASLPREERESELQEVRIERFQWLLGAALLLLVLEILIRARNQNASSKAALILLTLFALPLDRAKAEILTDREAYNQAHEALLSEDFDRANQLYTQAMQQSRDRGLQRDALFNMGHATYQQGMTAYNAADLEKALEKIRSAEALMGSALELDPSDQTISQDLDRTRNVRQAIEEFIEQQQDQQQQNQDSQNSEDSKEQDQQDGGQQDQESGENGEQNRDPEQEQEQEQEQEPSENAEQNQDSENQDGQSETSENSEAPGESSEEGSQGEQDTESGAQSEEGQEDATEQSSSRNEASGEDDEQAQTGSSTEEESGDEENRQPVPQVGEEGESEADPATEDGSAPQAVAVEGMTLEEAQDLLDSLRGNEEILPFAKPVPGKGRPLQDW
jgi:Ca-activated chloride channel family protein